MKVLPRTYTDADINNVAKEFSRVLYQWLGIEKMNAVVESNDKQEGCATHEHCDSNMAMNEAFVRILDRTFTFASDNTGDERDKQNTRDTNLFNAAWSLAIENKFYPEESVKAIGVENDIVVYDYQDAALHKTKIHFDGRGDKTKKELKIYSIYEEDVSDSTKKTVIVYFAKDNKYDTIIFA